MNSQLIAKSFPQLNVKEIADQYSQKNFRNLQDYFTAQNQLLNFNFIEQVFTGAVKNQKIAHGLSILPQDVIVSRITGAGTCTLNWGLFDSKNLDVTTTGACRVRLFVGSYWKNQTANSNNASDTQSLAATIQAAVNAAVAATQASFTMPSGSVQAFGGATVPTGWLLCDGSLINRVTYAGLFTAIGTTWGTGDGGTTFGLPDFRGLFLRGAGTNATAKTSNATAYAATLGVTSGDKFQGHYHTVSDPTHTHTIRINGATVRSAATSGSGVNNVNNTNGDSVGGNQWLNDTASTGITVTTPLTDGTNGAPLYGNETAPANSGVTYMIKT